MLCRIISELNMGGIARVQDLRDPLGCFSNQAIVPQPEHPLFSTADSKPRNLPADGFRAVNQFGPKSASLSFAFNRLNQPKKAPARLAIHLVRRRECHLVRETKNLDAISPAVRSWRQTSARICRRVPSARARSI